MVWIAPSILSADFADLKNEIRRLDEAGADLLHIDVMDGNFVPNLTFGPTLIKAIRPYTKLPFDVHLMITDPGDKIGWFAAAGADIITVHCESVTEHLDKVLDNIRALGCKVGVSINPATPEEMLKYVLDKVDLVLVMTVNPGFGGQAFISGQLEKIARIKQMIGTRKVHIEVDGGINPMTGAEAVAAGADILVAGTSVFSSRDYAANIAALR